MRYRISVFVHLSADLTTQSGTNDEPPAGSESSTPQTRRSRLRRALQSTQDLARDQIASYNSLPRPSYSTRRRMYETAPSRRRRRSESAHEDAPQSTPDAHALPDDGRQRTKRRKLDSSATSQQKNAIKYGHYGQVEAGRLKLDLISCDGGEHRDPRHPGTSLGPENLLRHDKSVYCSERPYCNLILKHVDDTPFCLEKLHIVGPEHGFTAP